MQRYRLRRNPKWGISLSPGIILCYTAAMRGFRTALDLPVLLVAAGWLLSFPMTCVAEEVPADTHESRTNSVAQKTVLMSVQGGTRWTWCTFDADQTHNRMGDCGYGRFLGHSLGSRKTLGRLSEKRSGEVRPADFLWCAADVDYCGFRTLELGYSAKSRRLARIVLEKAFETEAAAEAAFKTVRRDLEDRYALKTAVETEWQVLSGRTGEGGLAHVPGGLTMTVVKRGTDARGVLLRVVLQNDRLLAHDAGTAPRANDQDVEVGL